MLRRKWTVLALLLVILPASLLLVFAVWSLTAGPFPYFEEDRASSQLILVGTVRDETFVGRTRGLDQAGHHMMIDAEAEGAGSADPYPSDLSFPLSELDVEVTRVLSGTAVLPGQRFRVRVLADVRDPDGCSEGHRLPAHGREHLYFLVNDYGDGHYPVSGPTSIVDVSGPIANLAYCEPEAWWDLFLWGLADKPRVPFSSAVVRSLAE